VLEAHGLFTWAEDQKECYGLTIDTLNRAIGWLGDRSRGRKVFGGIAVPAAPEERRREVAAALMPRLRGFVSETGWKVGHFNDEPAVLISSAATTLPPSRLKAPPAPTISSGPRSARWSCPSIQRPTRSRTWPAAWSGIAAYRSEYEAYYERCRHADSPAIRDPNAVRVSRAGHRHDDLRGRQGDRSHRGRVLRQRHQRDAGGVQRLLYRGLPEQEAFDIEYWLLEEAKLQRMPKPKPLAGRVALVTGGAGGIGGATARRLAEDGACVVLCDIDRTALKAAEEGFAQAYGRDRVAAFPCDVTDEVSVANLFTQAALAFGGIDILVSNAGIASRRRSRTPPWSSGGATSTCWPRLLPRRAGRLPADEGAGRGGSIIFVASKNGLVASPNASRLMHRQGRRNPARALPRPRRKRPSGSGERGEPDAVLRGSRIWQGEWRDQRAQAYNTTPGRPGGDLPRPQPAQAQRLPGGISPRPCTSSPPSARRNRPATS
jgi:NAD(P)-dependent dehydrogenase (short-subunit alcohol dehydrogenase family)